MTTADAELLGKTGQCGVDRDPVGDGVDATVGEVVDDLASAAVGVVVDDVELGSALAFAEFVERGVGGDAVDPGRERRPAVEPVEVAHDADHRLLGGVVGVAGAAGDPAADGVHTVVVASEQLIHRGRVAAPAPLRRVRRRCGRGWSRTEGDLAEPTAERIRLAARLVATELLQPHEHVLRRLLDLHLDRAGLVRRSWSHRPWSSRRHRSGGAAPLAVRTSSWYGALIDSTDTVPVAGPLRPRIRPTPSLAAHESVLIALGRPHGARAAVGDREAGLGVVLVAVVTVGIPGLHGDDSGVGTC